MPRPLSWLPRLHLIEQSVANSVRSHYQRRDFERLFELQPRAAQLLMDALPTVGIGRSRLVEREHLLTFLRFIRQADNPAKALELARQERPAKSTRSLRDLVPHDFAPATWESLPCSLTLLPGQVLVKFGRVEDLAEALLALASLLDRDLEEFAERYELRPPAPALENREEVEGMFNELKMWELEKKA